MSGQISTLIISTGYNAYAQGLGCICIITYACTHTTALTVKSLNLINQVAALGHFGQRTL